MTRRPFRFLQGACLLLTGLRQLKQTGLKSCVLVPLLLNTILYILLVGVAFHQLSALLDRWLGQMPGWLGVFSFLLWPVLALTMAIVVLFSFTLVAHLIAAPFYGLLAEKVQRRLAPDSLPETSRWEAFVSVTVRTLSRELHKLSYILPRMLILLVISLIPLVNLISPWLWLAFSGWATALQYCDYAADNEGVSFRETRRLLASPRWPTWLFGASVSLCTLIPFAPLVLMPAAVIGGTHLWVERRHNKPQGI